MHCSYGGLMSVQLDHKGAITSGGPTRQGGAGRCSGSTGSMTRHQRTGEGSPVLVVVAPSPGPARSDVAELVEQHLALVDVLVAERLRNVPGPSVVTTSGPRA